MSERVPSAPPRGDLTGALVLFHGRATKKVPFVRLAKDVKHTRERLQGAGVEAGHLVGILGENCYEWVVYDLAVTSLGAIPVCFPVDEFAGRPASELGKAYDLSLLIISAMVGDPSHTPWVMTMNGEGVASARRPPDGPLRRRIAGTDVSTIIFSSGTSGQLKALLLSRAGVEMAVTSFAAWDLAPGDGILVALPLSIFQQRLMIYAALRADCDILLSDSVNLFRSLKVLSPSVVLGPPALFETVEKRFDALPGWRYALLALLSTLCAVLPSGARARARRHLFAEAHEAFGGRVRVLLTGSAPSKPSTLALYERAGIPLYQSYGLAEVGFIAWNRPGRNRALSVGHPVVPGSVTIAEDGEILVALDTPQAIGYYGVEPEEEQRTFLGGGRIATGDLGCFDGEGFLHITGRKKNLILLQSGEKIQSELLERRLGEVPGVECAVVVGGDPLPGLVALVAIDPSAGAEDEARVRDEVQRVVNTLNYGVKPGARIVRFIITRMPFKPKTGLVTRNLKIDRKAVVKIFEKELRA